LYFEKELRLIAKSEPTASANR